MTSSRPSQAVHGNKLAGRLEENRHENAAIWHKLREVDCRSRGREAAVSSTVRRHAPGEEIPRRAVRRPRCRARARSRVGGARSSRHRRIAEQRGTSTSRRKTSAHATQQALLSLYALDSQLQAWRARLASLETAATALRGRRGAALRAELRADRAALALGEHRLGHRATRPVPAGQRRFARRGARSEVAQHGPQSARRPFACCRPEPADRRSHNRGTSAACSGRNTGWRRRSAGSSARSPRPGRPRSGSQRRLLLARAYVSSLRAQEQLRRRRYRASRPRRRPPSTSRRTLQASRRRRPRPASGSSP